MIKILNENNEYYKSGLLTHENDYDIFKKLLSGNIFDDFLYYTVSKVTNTKNIHKKKFVKNMKSIIKENINGSGEIMYPKFDDIFFKKYFPLNLRLDIEEETSYKSPIRVKLLQVHHWEDAFINHKNSIVLENLYPMKDEDLIHYNIFYCYYGLIYSDKNCYRLLAVYFGIYCNNKQKIKKRFDRREYYNMSALFNENLYNFFILPITKSML